MAWIFASSDKSFSVDLNADRATARLNGAVSFDGKSFLVAGESIESPLIPGGGLDSAFSFSGQTQPSSDVPDFISASGIMNGDGSNTPGINIEADVSSSADGTLRHYSGVLLPVR
jgi:hypothetical protein